MACYAAVLSLLHTLNTIKTHPCPPISLHHEQLHSLTQNLTFFQHFLERFSRGEDDDLESRITDAAYAAEDVIETHIVDQIDHSGNISSVDLYGGLEKVIQDMDLIRNDMMEITKVKNIGAQQYDLFHTHSPEGPDSTWQSNTMATFDEVFVRDVLDKLTGKYHNLQIVPIVGMGGIGKTTIARNIYSNQLIVEHFDILVWVTISHVYSRRNILNILYQEINRCNSDMSRMSGEEIGERVRKELWGRRYLIVMDGVWSTNVWDQLKFFFPDNNNGSRILITTRLSNLAFELSGSQVFQMNFLDEGKSWNLLCRIVFGVEPDCPAELENLGKEIAKKCRGLPLSIVVIGGLLTKSNRTKTHWEYILQNLNSLVNLGDGEYCLQILHTSYKELPIYLKPCFLYMGIFRENHKIHVTRLVELWVAEGILRPRKEKTLEEVAEEYIKELIDRNLILVDKLRWNGKAKVCKIHDLLRDLCLREAQKQKFLCILKHECEIPRCMDVERRICIHDNVEGKYFPASEHGLLTRSLFLMCNLHEPVQPLSNRLLRVYLGDNYIHCDLASAEAIFRKANLRFLAIVPRFPQLSGFPPSWSLLWNLQTIKVVTPASWRPIAAPCEIWELSLLRHVKIQYLELPNPQCGEKSLILEDLYTLSRVYNLKCSEAVIKKIPNIKTLKLKYDVSGGDFGLNNIGDLSELQYLYLYFRHASIGNGVQSLNIPRSVTKLTLYNTMLSWKECMEKIGSLPRLGYLKLGFGACYGEEWETVEGQFCSLRVLHLQCEKLRYWRTEDTHFPNLEHLNVLQCRILEEIPSSIGDIPTLKSISLDGCSTSAEDSAKRIKEEQLDLENHLQLHILSTGAVNPSTTYAISYLMEVKNTLKHKKEKYDEFLDVLNDFKARRIDIDGVIAKVKVLFKEHPGLIPGFKIFLPEEYDEITFTEDEEKPPFVFSAK